MVISGAKAPLQFESLTARLKSCPDTCFVVDTITAAAKAVLIEAGTAGLKACSTPQGTMFLIGNCINAGSTPWGKNSPGLKPQVLERLDAALKGRSSTMQLYAANSLRSPLPEGKGWGRSSTTTGVR